MTESYGGAVVSVVEEPTDGYDPSIDYDALNGETVSCAATPAPHCEILEVCKQILADKGITLDIQEYDDYVIPNTIVEDGQCDTNYFQHQPTWTTSMRRRAPTWSPLPVSTLSPWASTAASRAT